MADRRKGHRTALHASPARRRRMAVEIPVRGHRTTSGMGAAHRMTAVARLVSARRGSDRRPRRHHCSQRPPGNAGSQPRGSRGENPESIAGRNDRPSDRTLSIRNSLSAPASCQAFRAESHVFPPAAGGGRLIDPPPVVVAFAHPVSVECRVIPDLRRDSRMNRNCSGLTPRSRGTAR